MSDIEEQIEQLKKTTFKKFFEIMNTFNNEKVITYSCFFLIYFFLYEIINFREITSNQNDNAMLRFIKMCDVNTAKIVYFIWIFIVICIFTSVLLYYQAQEKKGIVFTEGQKLKFILPLVLVAYLTWFFGNIILYRWAKYIYDSKLFTGIIVILLKVLTVFFFIFYGAIFFYNMYKNINAEAIVAGTVILLFLFEYLFITIQGFQNIYKHLEKDDFTQLSLNCFNNKSKTEAFDSSNDPPNIHNQEIAAKYGGNYLKTYKTIPIAFNNPKIEDYQSLTLNDFYYPGSYYSYLSDSPNNGTPSLEALQTVVQKFKCRIVHLDVFSDSNEIGNPDANPIVKCPKMKKGAKPISLLDCLKKIDEYCWIKEDPNIPSYPMMIYMVFHFDNNDYLYYKIYHQFISVFGKYLIDKRFGFAGRNGVSPVSKAPMIECIGKVILITSKYPTKTLLDEIINSTTSDLSSDTNLLPYKESYVQYEKLGLSQDFNKNEMVNNCKFENYWFYSLPNEKYATENNDKAGLYNPSFQDCAQYGVQSTLMYVYVPDENLNQWYMFFQNKNNFLPVLKDESLRYVKAVKDEVVKQNPVEGLQKPQKYCMIPGMIETEKSNIGANSTNETCNE